MTADARACKIISISRAFQHIDLERAAVEALEARDFRLAFALADRRCRIPPPPGARAYQLRAEALYHLDLREAAVASVAKALELEPDDLAAGRRMLTWGDGAQQIEVARSVARHDDDADIVRRALLLLEQHGQHDCARVDVLDEEVKGWVTWRGTQEPCLSLALADQSSIVTLASDPRHRYAVSGRHAASFRLMRPASASSQRLEITHAGRIVSSLQLPANRAADRSPTPHLPFQAGDSETTAVTIIIPVYRDLEATRACLHSVMAAVACTPGSHIVIVDDASPEPEIKDLLDRFTAHSRVTRLTNEYNLGFVGSINRALGQATAGDVVLLNSDTLVPKHALQRLRCAVRSTPGIGTATPLSNNGEYTSFPAPNRSNPLPSPANVERLDELAGVVNAGVTVDIPNGIGFCLYITRECLDAVPELSDDFYRGYLEDVDFCLRAAEAGFRNVCIPSVFVGHEGSRSFRGEKRSLVMRNLRVLEHRYRRYATECAAFLRADPLRDCRAALERELLSNGECTSPHIVLCGSPIGREIARERCRRLTAGGERSLIVDFRCDGPRQPAAIFDPAGGSPQSIGFDVASSGGREDLLACLAVLGPRSVEIAEPNRIPGACLAELTQHFVYDILITDTALAAHPTVGAGVKSDWTNMIAGARRVAAIGKSGNDFCEAVLGLKVAAANDPPLPQPRVTTGSTRLGLLALRPTAPQFRFVLALSERLACINVEIVVLGTSLDDLKLMRQTNVVVTGEIGVDDVTTLIAAHGIARLVLDIGDPIFGHPLTDALSATGLPTAATEWIPTRRRGRTADLRLRPGAKTHEMIAAICDWSTDRRQSGLQSTSRLGVKSQPAAG